MELVIYLELAMGMPIFFNFHYCHLCQSYYYFLSDFFQESESLVKPLLDALMLPLGVLVRVSIVMIEHHDQKQLGEERVYFSLHFYTMVHYQRKSRQEPEGRN